MLGWLRDARIDARTGIAVILLALLVWAVVVYVNVRDFVPDELNPPSGPMR
jgi:uncharacterized membrane-anchored protein